jgi:hypothetical protein
MPEPSALHVCSVPSLLHVVAFGEQALVTQRFITQTSLEEQFPFDKQPTHSPEPSQTPFEHFAPAAAGVALQLPAEHFPDMQSPADAAQSVISNDCPSGLQTATDVPMQTFDAGMH